MKQVSQIKKIATVFELIFDRMRIFNIYIEVTHNDQVFIFTQSFTIITSFIYSINILTFPAYGGLCTPKQTLCFLEIVNSEQIQSLQSGSCSFSLFQ